MPRAVLRNSTRRAPSRHAVHGTPRDQPHPTSFSLSSPLTCLIASMWRPRTARPSARLCSCSTRTPSRARAKMQPRTFVRALPLACSRYRPRPRPLDSATLTARGAGKVHVQSSECPHYVPMPTTRSALAQTVSPSPLFALPAINMRRSPPSLSSLSHSPDARTFRVADACSTTLARRSRRINPAPPTSLWPMPPGPGPSEQCSSLHACTHSLTAVRGVR